MKLFIRIALTMSMLSLFQSMGYSYATPQLWLGLGLFTAYGVICNLDK